MKLKRTRSPQKITPFDGANGRIFLLIDRSAIKETGDMSSKLIDLNIDEAADFFNSLWKILSENPSFAARSGIAENADGGSGKKTGE